MHFTYSNLFILGIHLLLTFSGGKSVILSSESVQQGDPLEPLLFCLSIHHIYTQLKREFFIFYLDDGHEDGIDTVKGLPDDIWSTLN